MKNAIMQVAYFMNDQLANFFYLFLFFLYIYRMLLLQRNLAKILTLKSELYRKCWCFIAIDGSIKS